MKIIIIGDVHAGHSKSSDIFHDYFEKSFEYIFDYAKINNIKTIIQTGDLFDYRREVHFNTLHRANQYFLNPIANYDFYAVSGNHDSLFKNTNHINSLRLLLRSGTIVDMTPKTFNFEGLSIDLYPWINANNQEVCIEFAKNSKSKIAIGHFEFACFPLSPGNEAETGMDHRIFKNYEKVISGHYHTQSTKDNVQYTGTPYELTWVDCNDPKGFWVLDTETLELKFIKNPHTLFLRIDYVEGMKYDFSLATGKYVKIISVEAANKKKFDAFIDAVNAAKPIDVKIIESSFVAAVSDAVGKKVDAVSTASVIESVIDNLETSLDKSLLKNKVMSKYNEALSVSNSL